MGFVTVRLPLFTWRRVLGEAVPMPTLPALVMRIRSEPPVKNVIGRKVPVPTISDAIRASDDKAASVARLVFEGSLEFKADHADTCDVPLGTA